MCDHDYLIVNTTIGVRILIDVRALRAFNISDWNDSRIADFHSASDWTRDILLAHVETLDLVGVAPNLNPWEVF